MSASSLETLFVIQAKAAELPSYESEFRFHGSRRWRFDFAWPEQMVAVEIEGGIWTGGRHTRGAGFEADSEKYNAAAEMGWTVLRYTPRLIRSGEAVAQVKRVLEGME